MKYSEKYEDQEETARQIDLDLVHRKETSPTTHTIIALLVSVIGILILYATGQFLNFFDWFTAYTFVVFMFLPLRISLWIYNKGFKNEVKKSLAAQSTNSYYETSLLITRQKIGWFLLVWYAAAFGSLSLIDYLMI